MSGLTREKAWNAEVWLQVAKKMCRSGAPGVHGSLDHDAGFILWQPPSALSGEKALPSASPGFFGRDAARRRQEA